MTASSLAMVGMATVDLTYSVPQHPGADTQVQPLEHTVAVGGLMGRAAIAAARLGGRPRFLGACGTGLLATVLREGLEAEGVDATWIEREGPSQHSVVLAAQREGTRSIVWLPQPRVDASVADVLGAFLDGVAVVLLDATDPVLAAEVIRACTARDITTVLDTGSGRPWTAELMADVDHVVASEKYTAGLTGLAGRDAAAALRPGGCRDVFAITSGVRGGAWAAGPSATDTGEWRAAPVDVVDSAGAGDVFHGTYAWALANGIGVEDAVEHAAWAAGLSTTRLGNEALPSLTALRSAMARARLVRPGPA